MVGSTFSLGGIAHGSGRRSASRLYASCGVIAAGLCAAAVHFATAAEAASGGGCRGTAVASCISYSGSQTALVADLYVNELLEGDRTDPSRCSAVLEIVMDTNFGKRSVFGGPFPLTTKGRQGPVTASVLSLPPTRGSAFTRLHIYTCEGRFHHRQDSETVHFP